MLPLHDPRWQTYLGGYRAEYDASTALQELLSQGPSESLWEELWNELHHQGDVDQASYAAVPWLVESIRRSPTIEWNSLSLIVVIELEREADNPPINQELAEAYSSAIASLPEVLGSHPDRNWGELVIAPATAGIALARGHRWYAQACFELNSDTAKRWFSAEFGWNFST